MDRFIRSNLYDPNLINYITSFIDRKLHVVLLALQEFNRQFNNDLHIIQYEMYEDYIEVLVGGYGIDHENPAFELGEILSSLGLNISEIRDDLMPDDESEYPYILYFQIYID